MTATAKLRAVELVTERDWQTWVTDLARLHGWTWYHTHDSRHSNAGWPDLVLWRPPEFLIVELKRERGKVTGAQGAVLTALEQCGIEVHVWRPSDAERVVTRLRRAR